MPGIPDDELVYIRIPPGPPWVKDDGGASSANFKLDKRKNEEGLSVYRSSIVSEQDVLAKTDAIPGSKILKTTAGDIRSLVNGERKRLNLDVIEVPIDGDPGHAEIRPKHENGWKQSSCAKALSKLFTVDN